MAIVVEYYFAIVTVFSVKLLTVSRIATLVVITMLLDANVFVALK